ncbi:hypothetical protein [Accumulibacter sp.]|uniref:hypothetical protein n=1 Tax=Accumulibacter sp. TaxID=2053492 RepID=UPI0028C3B6C4|nr:hypothetical protein [Accumulibacter sp.]
MLLSAALLYLIARVCRPAPAAWHSGHSRSAILLIVATACAWSAFGGGSHFLYANPDWEIRDAVLGDLAQLDWPVHYLAADGAPLILRSAIGYFLPPALFGKIFGLAHLDLAVYLWTTAGVLIFLLLLPLPGRAGWRLGIGLLLVVFFSGMDIVGVLIATEALPIFPLRLEWWVPLSYPSLTGQLLWAPNHALAGWIAALLCFRHRQGREFLRVASAMLPLTLIWTPFAVIGLLPFVVLGAINSIRKFGWRSVPWDAAIAATVVSLPLLLFLTIDVGHIESAVPTVPTAGARYALQAVSLHSYLLFVGCEFLFLAMVIAPHLRAARAEFWLAVGLLLALPLLRFGPTNDLGLRLSTIPLVILLVICLQTLLAPGQGSSRSTLWIAGLFLVIGAHTAFNEFWRAVVFPHWRPDYRQTLADRQGGQPAAHYVGHLGASPLQRLLKPLPAAPRIDPQ